MDHMPLSGGFMVFSMFSFLISAVYTYSGKIDPTWGATMILMFIIMFISSVLSVTPQFPARLRH